MTDTPRGGMEFSFRGETIGAGGPMTGPNNGSSPSTALSPTQGGTSLGVGDPPAAPQNPFAGMGPILEDQDDKVFKQTDGLVLRQELLARNHLAQDAFYTCLVAGYPWATLTHDTTRDTYQFTLPYGASQTTIQAVPNKNLDLINKTTGALLVDFPEANAEPTDDSDEARAAADMANRFLTESASEQGTNDAVLIDDRVRRALVTASTYIEGWVDPSGGGYVPLQIDAHRQAQSPLNPLIGPDGSPTTETVLRYVTGPINPDGTPSEQSQFTDDPSQAAPQWQPAIRATAWQREHIRVFPEDQPVHFAEKVIVLGYCTLSQAKRRWQSVAQMQPDQLSKLCDWQPQRYLVLLPPFQRARWMLTDGRKEKDGAGDERLMFYYHIYQRATPDYPKGADVVVTGALGGLVIDRQLLASDVPVNKGQGRSKETRCREIPVVQVTPRGDPNGRDPSGLAYLEQFVGATEFTATLATNFGEAMDKVIRSPFVIPSTSPIEGWQVQEARSTEDFLIVNRPEDKPTQLDPPVLPNAFFEMYNIADQAIDSIATQERAAQGNENSQERSGKALQIAISRNSVAAAPMQNAVNNAVARWNRIKVELAMSSFTTDQFIKYEGEDGSYKADAFTGVDFALVGKVSIKAGTGTGMDPVTKVQYLAQLGANGMIDPDEQQEAARPAFSKQLGLVANPHEQYVERCVDAWLDGPPDLQQGDPTKPTWAQLYQTWLQAQTVYQQQLATYQQQAQAYQVALQATAIVQGGPPPIALGPQQQYDQAMIGYQQAMLSLQQNPLAPVAPVAPQPPQVPKPWTPFNPRPNDTEPRVAAIWMSRLSRAMSTTKYDEYGPEWQDVLSRQYNQARQAVAVVSTPQPAPAPQAVPGATPQSAAPGGPQTHQQSPASHVAPRSPQAPHAVAA